MLEQPPERSQLEVEAEAAARAQTSPQRRLHGCFRILVWCMPTLLFYGVYAAVAYVSVVFFPGRESAFLVPVIFVLITALTFGVGYFDGHFAVPENSTALRNRQQSILGHAAKFTAWQILLIPALTVLMIGACAMIFSMAGSF